MRTSYNVDRNTKVQEWMLESTVDFSRQTTRLILSKAERLLNASQEAAKVKRRVFMVMAESLQNLMKHTDMAGPNGCSQKALFLLAETPSHYTVISQNVISNTKVAALTNRLDFINRLNKAKLKDVYRKTIQSDVLVKNGSAGLGLLDIARKSGQELTFNFQEMFRGYYFFLLKVKVKREEK